MKINDIKPSVETSGNLEEQFFSVQDQGMIFDILRNKMYSNPILAICREISCNARDAHREVGKQDVPIEICLPNHLSPVFKIKDFGPGISPDRMSNVFIKYTASTKRNDNIQTGGFGLGAKTPFSYSDTFNIVTVFNGIKYNYSCVIDETKVGKLLLLSSVSTDESNSTEIIIPVLKKDFVLFYQNIETATRFWDVKPIFFGHPIEYTKNNYFLEGDDWKLGKNTLNYYNKTFNLIVDGISYSVDYNTVISYTNSNFLKSLDNECNNIELYFNVGELTLSANREQVYLDVSTKQKITDKVNKLALETQNIVSKKIDDCKNLWEANILARTIFLPLHHSSVFKNLKWKNIALSLRDSFHANEEYSVHMFKKNLPTDRVKISKQNISQISFRNNSTLYFNDLDTHGVNLTSKHIKNIFEKDKTLQTIQIISLNKSFTLSDIEQKYHFDKMDYKLLSSELTIKSKKKYSTSNKEKILYYKFDLNTNYFKFVSVAKLEKDNNKKILVNLGSGTELYRQVSFTFNEGEDSGRCVAESISDVGKHIPKYSIYGISNNLTPTISDRIKKYNFLSFKDAFEICSKQLGFDLIEIGALDDFRNKLPHHIVLFLSNLNVNKTNLIYKFTSLYNTLFDSKSFNTNLEFFRFYKQSYSTNTKKMIALDKSIKDCDLEISKIYSSILDRYPLIRYLADGNHYHYNYNEENKKPLFVETSNYINLIDSVKK